MAKLRFGIVGLHRGACFIDHVRNAGAELVACCDGIPGFAEKVVKSRPEIADTCAYYEDYDEFLKHDMDAVILVNYFSEHAPFAIKAMRAGKHVLSETISNVCMADGVELVRTVEETGKIYGLLENYPYTKANQAMAGIYKSGELGSIVYGEGEYAHPMTANEQNALTTNELHWRNWTPRTFYSTHALAPVMFMTDSMPTKVTTMASFKPELAKGTALRTGDACGIMLVQTDTDAVFRIVGWSVYNPHFIRYRLSCTKGSVETMDAFAGKIKNSLKDDFKEYEAEWPDEALGKLAETAGHGGGDFMIVHEFIKALEKGEHPYFDVYRATAMASVAILGWRSVLNGNCSYDIPDFRREEDRKKYEFDRISPYPDKNGVAVIPTSSKPYAPTEADIAQAKEYWETHKEKI